MTQTKECHVCKSIQGIEDCRACQKPICPAHRVGTGSLSAGYTCVGAGSSCWLGLYVGDELKTPKPKIRRWNWEWADTKLVLIVFGLVVFGIALGFLTPAHRPLP